MKTPLIQQREFVIIPLVKLKTLILTLQVIKYVFF
jgi:hypothetical protein